MHIQIEPSSVDRILSVGSIPRIFPYVSFFSFAVREGGGDHINNCFLAEQKTSRCHLRAVFAAKVGFSLKFELLAIFEEDTFLLPLKILDALDQFGNAAAGTRERKLSEMWGRLKDFDISELIPARYTLGTWWFGVIAIIAVVANSNRPDLSIPGDCGVFLLTFLLPQGSL